MRIIFFPNFKALLGDDNILKVGVGSQEMANYLFHDFDILVKNTLDIRFMASVAGCEPNGLKEMSEYYSKEYYWKLSAHWEWEKPKLCYFTILSAAKDPHIAIELFKFFGRKLQSKRLFEDQSDYIQRLINTHCHRYINIYFGDNDRIDFERLEKVYSQDFTKCYKIEWRTRCVVCGETAMYHKSG